MRRLALALTVPLLLAGCLASVQDPATSGGKEAATYRFVEVRANWTAQPEPHVSGMCGFPSTPDVDEEAKTVTFYGDDWPGNDFAGLILTVTWDRTYCGTAHTSWAAFAALRGRSDGGEPTFEFRESDGALLFNGEEVPRGGSASWAQRGTLSDGRTYHHEMLVIDHGDWPRAGLKRAA